METIDLINFFLGIFFILLGWLIYKNPNLISGYNTMSKAEKENFDINMLKKVLRNGLVYGGIFIILVN